MFGLCLGGVWGGVWGMCGGCLGVLGDVRGGDWGCVGDVWGKIFRTNRNSNNPKSIFQNVPLTIVSTKWNSYDKLSTFQMFQKKGMNQFSCFHNFIYFNIFKFFIHVVGHTF